MTQAVAAQVSELTPGRRVVLDFSVTDADMAGFASLSGDYNPLHSDDAFARSKGFQGRVVYAGMLVAKVSQLIGMHLPGRDSVWASLALDFRQPLYVNEVAQLEGSVDKFSDSAGLALLKLVIRAGDKVLAKGKAEVAVAR